MVLWNCKNFPSQTSRTSMLVFLYAYFLYVHPNRIPNSPQILDTEFPRYDGLMGDAVEVKNSVAAPQSLAHASASSSC